MLIIWYVIERKKKKRMKLKWRRWMREEFLALNGFQCYSFIHPFTFLVSFFSVQSLSLCFDRSHSWWFVAFVHMQWQRWITQNGKNLFPFLSIRFQINYMIAHSNKFIATKKFYSKNLSINEFKTIWITISIQTSS